MVAKKKKTTAKRGRPPLPDAERSAARVTVRLVPRSLAQLEALRALLGVSDVEVLRIALDELAARRLPAKAGPRKGAKPRSDLPAAK